MLFSESTRCLYTRSQLIEVVCQFRFSANSAIAAGDLTPFRQAVSQDFPKYLAKLERPAPAPVDGHMEERPPVTNHHFISADGLWKLNLTPGFVALSTLRYHRWEEFAFRLDKPLALFLEHFAPERFSRVGLRYVNAISRKALGLTGELWDDLIQSPYLGVLGEPDVDESMVSRCSVDTEFTLPDGCRAKLHAGPGLLHGGRTDPEIKFILDSDFSLNGPLAAGQIPASLDTLHTNAGDLFRAAITPTLHAALGPQPLE